MALVSCSRPDLTTARHFGRFILGQRLPNGEFIHIREYPKGRVRVERAPNGAGPALLALAALYRATHELQYFDAVAESVDALAARAYGVRQRSHWMLLVIDALDDMSPDPQNVQYAAAIAAALLAEAPPDGRCDGGRETIALAATLGLVAYLRIAARAGERSRTVTEARTQAGAGSRPCWRSGCRTACSCAGRPRRWWRPRIWCGPAGLSRCGVGVRLSLIAQAASARSISV